MLTRCPSCATHFRVTADQLKLRAGRVRCGECQHVFNALDTLIEEPALFVVPSPHGTPDGETAHHANLGADAAEHPPADIELPAAAGDTAPPLHDEAPIEMAPGAADETAEQEPAPAAEPPGEPQAAPDILSPEVEADAPDTLPVDEVTSEKPEDDASGWADAYDEPPPPRRWPWVVGALLALLALGLQAIVTFRVELAVLWPEARPLLAAACEPLGCTVGLPAKVALVGIEASDLHPDTGQPGRLALTATLKNRAPFAQQFPHLELTLTDTADKPLVRKVVGPELYLPRGMPLANGMMPNADIAVNLALDAGNLPASGYRLYIFYP